MLNQRLYCGNIFGFHEYVGASVGVIFKLYSNMGGKKRTKFLSVFDFYFPLKSFCILFWLYLDKVRVRLSLDTPMFCNMLHCIIHCSLQCHPRTMQILKLSSIWSKGSRQLSVPVKEVAATVARNLCALLLYSSFVACVHILVFL